MLSLQACRIRGGGNSTKGKITNAAIQTDRGIYNIEYATEGETLLFSVIDEPKPGSDSTIGSLEPVMHFSGRGS